MSGHLQQWKSYQGQFCLENAVASVIGINNGLYAACMWWKDTSVDLYIPYTYYG